MGETKDKGIAGPKQDEDLQRNPGIGQSPGLFARGGRADEAEGDSTVEGDIGNDPDAQGRANAVRLGRTND